MERLFYFKYETESESLFLENDSGMNSNYYFNILWLGFEKLKIPMMIGNLINFQFQAKIVLDVKTGMLKSSLLRTSIVYSKKKK